MQDLNWRKDPFPHLVIDNFLPKEEFEALKHELDQSNNLIQRTFKTPLENVNKI